MPIVQGIKRINPLDLNKNVKIGVAFPLDEKNMFKGTETMREQIKANLLNLLLTHPGERVTLPNYGLGLRHLLFENDIDIESLQIRVQHQINTYIPNIKLLDVSTGLSQDRHTLFVSLTYSYILDNTKDTIQLNFS